MSRRIIILYMAINGMTGQLSDRKRIIYSVYDGLGRLGHVSRRTIVYFMVIHDMTGQLSSTVRILSLIFYFIFV